jgi:LigD, primase-polymerase domain
MVADVRIGRRDVRLTNLDKVFFPERGLTNGDLVRYYVDVAPHVLHHVRNRPMQMKRYPNGVDGEFFYQKRVPVPHPDWLQTVHIRFPSGRTADFPVCQNAASLAWIVNLGCIELHTWHSRVADTERPDYLLIDLDPSDGNPWEFVRESALGRQRGYGRARLSLVPEDLGRHRTSHPRANQVGASLSRRSRLRQGAGPGGGPAGRERGRGHDDLEGRRPAWRLRRLRPERSRPDDRLRLLDSADSGCARLRAVAVGGGRAE